MLSTDGLIYYDYVEGGELQGGVLDVDPTNPLHTAIEGQIDPGGFPRLNSATLVDNGPSSNRIDLVFVGDGYTAAELGDYATDVTSLYPSFFAESPLDEYSTFFNVHRVDVVSNESGVDHDPYGVFYDTALDATFWCNGIERLLCVNVSKTLAAAANAPDVDQTLVLANSTKYGGAGYATSNVGTMSLHPSSLEVGLHEFGHSFADLADEYDYGDGATYTGSEPSAANVSIHNAATMDGLDAKWHRWLPESNVDTFEGAMYHQYGIYRPTYSSLMRSLGQPFEQVNTEQFVLSAYKTVSPIDAATPGGAYDASTVFFVDPVDPATHALDVQWSLDGAPISGATGLTLDPASLGLGVGTYSLGVTVVDNTNMVRDETLRQALMREDRFWTLQVGAGDPDDQISEANPITVGASWSGRIDPELDVDMFAFTATVNQGIVFDIDGDSSDYVDTIVRLFDASGAELALNDDGLDLGPVPEVDLRDSLLYYVFPAGGTYYLGVSAFANFRYDPITGGGDRDGYESGNYVLSLSTADLLTVSGTRLLVEGSPLDDAILFTPGPSASSVRVEYNGAELGPFGPITRIVASGRQGWDLIDVADTLSIDSKLVGDEDGDILNGGGGNDVLVGGPGDDTLSGGVGNDVLKGKAGWDLLFGQAGDDLLLGGAGRDVLRGQNGNDTLRGNAGDDILRAGYGSDVADGGYGRDIVLGAAGNDTITGGPGRDLVIGGLGADNVFGGADDDILVGGTVVHDTDDDKLTQVLGEWLSPSSYMVRVDHLRGTPGGLNDPYFMVVGVDVIDDGAVDNLSGESERDWFFSQLGADTLVDWEGPTEYID